MNRISIVLTFVLFGMLYGNAQTYLISGTLRYRSVSSPPMDSCTIQLMQNGTVVSTAIVNAQGYYQFANISAGTYTFSYIMQKKWRTNNASDALAIVRYYVGIPPLISGLGLEAAKISPDPYINSLDALLCAARFVGINQNYPGVSDWVFDNPTILVNNQNVTQDIYCLNRGDVDGNTWY